MPISIQVNDNEVPALVEFYQVKVEETKRVLAAYEAMLEKLKNTNSHNGFSTTPIKSTILPDGYNPQWIWLLKINHILKDQSLTTTQIVEGILEREPQKRSERSKVVASVSAILSTKSKEGGIYNKELNDRQENVYSLKDKSRVVAA